MVWIVWIIGKYGRGLQSVHSNYDSALTTLKIQVEGGSVNEKPKGKLPMNEVGYGVLKVMGERADGMCYQITQHNIEG